MNSPPPQPTRYEALQNRLGERATALLRRSWRGASLAMLGLLGGFWLGQNISTLLLVWTPGNRPAVALAMLVVIELLVRLRSNRRVDEPGLIWVVLDNLRLGATYAVVLEAFKLGS
ncbi:MAG: DUF565 domain-containing protein [Synechococcaceae cyanobacterium]|nr:DUF565 domain-containing protein [Synechococcaceae cyanobacterium]